MTRERAYRLRVLIEKASESLNDSDALEVVEWFPSWSSEGVEYVTGKRVRFNDVLYACRQAHTSQSSWSPDVATSLWEAVAEPGQGDSPSNPIPYNNNMALENGKYYSQNGVVYRCTRDTGVPVYNNLADLVGIYVEVVQ